MQISENQRIRLLLLAQKSGQARCKAASSSQNTGNSFRASWQQELRCQKDAGSSCPERHSRQPQNSISYYERSRAYPQASQTSWYHKSWYWNSEQRESDQKKFQRRQAAEKAADCQYTSYAFRRELVTNGLIQSLSGTAHCYDNARMESFFATLKKEKLYQIPTYRMKREEVKTVIFRYIFGYYNTQRINSFNAGGLPPVALRTSKQLSHHAAWLLPIHDFGYSPTAHFLTIPQFDI